MCPAAVSVQFVFCCQLKVLCLKELDLDNSAAWQGLAQLTQLQRLEATAVNCAHLADLLLLTACKQLTHLQLEVSCGGCKSSIFVTQEKVLWPLVSSSDWVSTGFALLCALQIHGLQGVPVTG